MGIRLVPEGNWGGATRVFPKGRHGLSMALCQGELSVRLWGLSCLRVAAGGIREGLSPNMGAPEVSGHGV